MAMTYERLMEIRHQNKLKRERELAEISKKEEKKAIDDITPNIKPTKAPSRRKKMVVEEVEELKEMQEDVECLNENVMEDDKQEGDICLEEDEIKETEEERKEIE